MPEMPQVQALVEFLGERMTDRAVVSVELASISALKTFSVIPQSLTGRPIDEVNRYGKFIDIVIDGTHVVVHLAKAGWLAWYEQVPTKRLRPGGKSAVAMRLGLDDGSGFELTEAGTRKGLAIYLVQDLVEIDGISRLGPEPMSADFTLEVFTSMLTGRRKQLKGLLRDQKVVAGIGNAYSDEILHRAKMSPFALADGLDETDVHRLYEALRATLAEAVESARGVDPSQLKDSKRSAMRVHGRTGERCDVCGDVVREVSFADSSLQYCATCQTGGQVLADRRTSKFVK